MKPLDVTMYNSTKKCPVCGGTTRTDGKTVFCNNCSYISRKKPKKMKIGYRTARDVKRELED